MSNVERQMQALLALLEEDCKRQCDALIADAQARARSVVKQAHRDARAHIRAVFAEERQRLGEQTKAAAARLQAERRISEQERLSQLLRLAWQMLPGALLERWRNPGQRRKWVAQAIDSAHRLLPREMWTLSVAPGWPPEERDEALQAVARRLGTMPACSEVAELQAGLLITAGGNRLDATLGGLLADRAAIEARLLDYLERYP
jgi:vacuolar-type H+-ATPase subunit H